MKIPKSEIERLVEKLHDEANKYREYEITKDEIRSILCANVTALEEIVRLAHFLAFPPEPAPPVAERGDDETFDKVVWGFLRPDDEVQRMLADLRERCAKACDERANAIAVSNGVEPPVPLDPVSEFISNQRRVETSFREQTVRDCAAVIRALPLTTPGAMGGPNA